MNEPELKTKEGELGLANPTNPTETETLQVTDEQKQEQERTTVNKKLFLEFFPRNNLYITKTCDKINISRDTYYDWRDTDPEFKKAVERVQRNMLDEAEDVLVGLVLTQKDPPSVRYFLDRNHPKYTPHSKTEVVVGDRTLEDLIDEKEKKINDKPDGTTKDTTGPEIPNREVIQDTKQEGADSAVHIQPGAELLLEKENETKPNSESETKGNIESDRRRPAPRLHSERN